MTPQTILCIPSTQTFSSMLFACHSVAITALRAVVAAPYMALSTCPTPQVAAPHWSTPLQGCSWLRSLASCNPSRRSLLTPLPSLLAELSSAQAVGPSTAGHMCSMHPPPLSLRSPSLPRHPSGSFHFTADILRLFSTISETSNSPSHPSGELCPILSHSVRSCSWGHWWPGGGLTATGDLLARPATRRPPHITAPHSAALHNTRLHCTGNVTSRGEWGAQCAGQGQGAGIKSLHRTDSEDQLLLNSLFVY